METSVETGPVLDVGAERARTPGSLVAHHFNAAGAALPTTSVVASVVDHLLREQAHGGYEAAAMVLDRVEAVYDAAAVLVGGHRDEIALFDSATTGLRTLVDALRFSPGHRLVVSRSTYVSHAMHLVTLARERDVDLHIVPNGADGAIDLEQLEDLLRAGGPTTVCVAHVPTSSGVVEPVEEIGALTVQNGARFVLDATQSVGHLALDVRRTRCDALVTTGRKFLRAPRGTGFAWVSAGLVAELAPTAPDVRGARWTSDLDWELSPAARRFETWESAVAGRLGLGTALGETLERGIETVERHLVGRAAQLRSALGELPGVAVQDAPAARSGIVTFTVAGLPARQVVQLLAERRVRVVAVPAIHAQWDLGARDLDAVVRASLHVYNDGSDTAALVGALAEVGALGEVA